MVAIAKDFQTLLQFYDMGIPFYSTRGATQTLAPIPAAGNLIRDVRGELVDLSYAPFHLYRSTITCTDQRVPAVDSVWPGTVVAVDCVCELSKKVNDTSGGGEEYLGRPAVPNSIRFERAGDEPSDPLFVFYRPHIHFLITDFQLEHPEWDGEVTWTMQLEEIKLPESTATG